MSPPPAGKPVVARLRDDGREPAAPAEPGAALHPVSNPSTPSTAPGAAMPDVRPAADASGDPAMARAEPDAAPAQKPPQETTARERQPQETKPDSADEKDKKPSPTLRQRIRQHPYITALVIVVIVAAIVGGIIWWLNARQYEATDDAFIDARTASLGAEVSGAITDVPVTDNQVVDAGAVLVRIDQRDYLARLAQAKAQVAQAQGNIDNLDAQISAQDARIVQANQQIPQAKAALAFSQQENTRYQKLVQSGAGTEQRAQQATSDLTQKQAAYDSAAANLLVAQRQIAVLQTQREAAIGQRDQAAAMQTAAEANLTRTTVRAPNAGRVTKLSAARGSYAQIGQALLMFVPREVWVTANFKETQLDLMRPGQPVTIRVDAFPGREFDGHVDSIQAGSGTAFSLLPAENATGNYVKVVQRVPVKIVFEHPPNDVLLGPGMSVVPRVKVR